LLTFSSSHWQGLWLRCCRAACQKYRTPPPPLCQVFGFSSPFVAGLCSPPRDFLSFFLCSSLDPLSSPRPSYVSPFTCPPRSFSYFLLERLVSLPDRVLGSHDLTAFLFHHFGVFDGYLGFDPPASGVAVGTVLANPYPAFFASFGSPLFNIFSSPLRCPHCRSPRLWVCLFQPLYPSWWLSQPSPVIRLFFVPPLTGRSILFFFFPPFLGFFSLEPIV